MLPEVRVRGDKKSHTRKLRCWRQRPTSMACERTASLLRGIVSTRGDASYWDAYHITRLRTYRLVLLEGESIRRSPIGERVMEVLGLTRHGFG